MPAAKKAAAKKAAGASAASAAKAPVKKAATAKATAKRTSTRTASSRAAAKKDSTPVKKDDASAATGNTGTKPVFDAKFLEAQRLLLLEERATYQRQAETLQAEADSLAELREPGDVQFDEESGEGDTLAVERERDLALSARARQEIEEIDRALVKITEGTYGICEVSGEPIPRARLQAIPQARERVEYKVGGFGRR
jgi:RNA polymerase-binding transcription factor DksA